MKKIELYVTKNLVRKRGSLLTIARRSRNKKIANLYGGKRNVKLVAVLLHVVRG